VASLHEAFVKFRAWKDSRTSLRLTIVQKGESPEIHRGQISAIDEAFGLLNFVDKARSLLPINLTGASFRIGKMTLEAERDGDYLKFEQVGSETKGDLQ
jgi:hypothetical protein